MSSGTQPIRLSEFVAAIGDLSDENLQSLQAQLRNSIQKLHETIAMLQEEITTTRDEDELNLYRETIEENKQVIESQNSRLLALDTELASRGLTEESSEGVYLWTEGGP